MNAKEKPIGQTCVSKTTWRVHQGVHKSSIAFGNSVFQTAIKFVAVAASHQCHQCRRMVGGSGGISLGSHSLIRLLWKVWKHHPDQQHHWSGHLDVVEGFHGHKFHWPKLMEAVEGILVTKFTDLSWCFFRSKSSYTNMVGPRNLALLRRSCPMIDLHLGNRNAGPTELFVLLRPTCSWFHIT